MNTKVLVPTVDQLLNRFNREFVGFDEVKRLLEDTGHVLNPHAYPPYNIEKIDEEQARLTLQALRDALDMGLFPE